MTKDPKKLFYLILGEIEELESFVDGFTFLSFEKNSLVQNAVFKKIENIGESIKNLPDNFKEENKNIPWRVIADTRNFLIHEYFEIKNEEIWNIIKEDIPFLKSFISKFLKK